jgi:hypothetical protein
LIIIRLKMKDNKLIEYLFPSKKKKTIRNDNTDDKQKYDARLLTFLSSDQVICFLVEY